MKILFVPLSETALAHIVRCLVIALEAKKEGHEVLFTSIRGRTDLIDGFDIPVYKNGIKLLKNTEGEIDKISQIRRYEIEAARYFHPDVIINDPVIAGSFAARKLNLPLVLVTNSTLLPNYSGYYGYSKVGKDLTSNFGYFGNYYPRKVMFPKILKVFDRLDIKNIPRHYNKLFDRNLKIIPSIPLLDPLDNPDSLTHYVGPLLLENHWKPDSELVNFVNKVRGPLVAVNFGGSVFLENTYHRTIEVLLSCGYKIVVGIGPNFDIEKFQNKYGKDNNLLIRQYTPNEYLAERAKFFIISGGHGTLTQTLLNGCPVLCIPHNVDQSTFAQRVEELGCGINVMRIDKPMKDLDYWRKKASNLSKNKLFDAIKKLEVNVENFRTNCRQVGDQLSKHSNPAKKILDLTEEFVDQKQRL